MAWDTQDTQRRLLEAARIEFARHGHDGATMARIAESAGINKERLYNYFGDKPLRSRVDQRTRRARTVAGVSRAGL